MSKGLIAFGAALVGLTAVVAHVGTDATFGQVAERIRHPRATYQLTLEADGHYYVTDYDMSLGDCYDRLTEANMRRAYFEHYSCDRQPEETR